MSRTVVAALTPVVLLASTVASAQCRSDSECKGDRICVDGRCQSPGESATLHPPPPPSSGDGAVTPPPPPPAVSPDPGAAERAEQGSPPSAVREVPGWAVGGAVFGFVSAATVAGLSLGSAVTTGDAFPSLALGILATVVFGVTVPIVASAAGSARNGTGVSGAVALRVLGWVFYGLTLATAVVAVVLGVTSEIPAPLILALGGLGLLTEVFMAIDALVSRGQAGAVVEQNRRATAAVKLAPVLTLWAARSGRGTLASVGLAGTF